MNITDNIFCVFVNLESKRLSKFGVKTVPHLPMCPTAELGYLTGKSSMSK